MNIIHSKIKFGIAVVGLALLFWAPHGAAAQASGLEDLVSEALDNNPRIQEAYHNWKAAEQKVKQARSLADPMVRYGYMGQNVETRVGPQEQRYGVSQDVPFPGKLALKGKAQTKEAQALQEAYQAARNEVIKQVKFVYYDLFWVDRALQTSEGEKSILENLEKVAQRRYESNLVAQSDVIKVEVELSKIIQKIFQLRQNRESLIARMNSLLNRNPQAAIAPTGDVAVPKFSYALEDILQKVRGSRQELLAANLAVERAEYERSLAKMDYLPNFSFGFEYIEVGSGTTSLLDDGQDAWMTTIAVNVPLWVGKLRANVREKEAALQAARKRKEGIENEVVFEAQDLYFKINTYKDIVLLYETALIPQAQQAFDATQIGFETGAVTFLDWLDTERTYLQTRLAYYKALADYHKSVAYLERVVGGTL